MRGRLIFRMTAVIARLDTVATEAAGDYDDDFRETIKRDTDGDGVGEQTRHEMASVELPVQVETNRDEIQRMGLAGNISESSIGLVAHRRDLETRGLIDADGTVSIRVNDRLVEIKDGAGNKILSASRVPMYCTHAKLLDGWIGRSANLVLFLFDERPQGVRG